jgi:hypothetical protein
MARTILAAAFIFTFTFIHPSPVQIRLTREANSKGPLPVQRDGKWGFLDLTGKIVIAPRFESAYCFYEGLAAVRLNGKWGFIDPTGKLVIPAEYTSLSSFSDGLASVFIDGPTPPERVYGYIDKTGQMINKCPQACGRPYYDGMMGEMIEAFRCVDEQGRRVPKEYPCTPDANSKSRPVLVDIWGYYDKTGKLAIPGPFHSGGSRFSEGLAAAQPHGTQKMGFIDKSGTFVIKPQFDRAEAFSGGLAAVRIGERWGFVDLAGKIAVEPQFDGAGTFSDGYATIYLNRQAGYIDKNGQIIILPRFAEASPFSEGLAAVCCENEKTGYIDKSGTFVIKGLPPGLTDAGPFSEGIALVESETGLVYIDRTGKVIAAVKSAR